jgi:hypothetical protein
MGPWRSVLGRRSETSKAEAWTQARCSASGLTGGRNGGRNLSGWAQWAISLWARRPWVLLPRTMRKYPPLRARLLGQQAALCGSRRR